MAQNIVTEIVSTQSAPLPNTLQSTGAIVSQGATTVAVGTYAPITQMSDLTAILTPPAAISALTWTAGVVTATTTAPHNIPTGTNFSITVAGATPTGYNGNVVCTSTGANTFTYPVVTNPGAATVFGTWVPGGNVVLIAQATTYFAQSTGLSFYVLELGPGNSATGVTGLATFIGSGPQFFYAYLLPPFWRGEPTLITFVSNYTAANAKTYFHIQLSSVTYASYAGMKSVVGTLPAPTTPGTEVTSAAIFAKTLAYAPSPINKVTTLQYGFVYGVTAYPTAGNSALLLAAYNAGVNYIGYASEGGLTNTMIVGGTTMDNKSFNYWYAADYAQISIDLNLANEIINGSNNPLNPLVFNQPGIDRLKARAQQTLNTGATYGLYLSTPKNPVTVTAIPFTAYVLANPSDYGNGVYKGLFASIVPQTGFQAITFAIQVTNFTTG